MCVCVMMMMMMMMMMMRRNDGFYFGMKPTCGNNIKLSMTDADSWRTFAGI